MQPRGVQRQHEVGGAEVGELVVAEDQLFPGAEVQRDVRSLLGHRGLDLGEGGQPHVVEPRTVYAGLEVGDDVVAVALAHDEHVGTRPAGQGVIARHAIERLGARGAGQDVVEGVAAAISRIAEELQVLDIVRQGVAQGGEDGVIPLAGILDHDGAWRVDPE